VEQQSTHFSNGWHVVSFAQSVVTAVRVQEEPVPFSASVVRQVVQALLTMLIMVAMQSVAVHVGAAQGAPVMQPHSLSW
jgi:hypothetical protein